MMKTGSTDEQSMMGGQRREQELISFKLFAIGTKLGNSKSQVNFLRCCEMKNVHPEDLPPNSLTIERKKYEEEARILSAKAKKIKDKLYTISEKISVDTVVKKFNNLILSILQKNKIKNDEKLNKLEQLQFEKDFCDVTLACDNNQIKAHKVILPNYDHLTKVHKNSGLIQTKSHHLSNDNSTEGESSVGSNSCRQCLKSFSSKNHIKKQDNDDHHSKNNSMIFNLKPTIPNHFTNSYILKGYLKLLRDDISRGFNPCDQCQKTLSLKSNIKNQLKINRSQIKITEKWLVKIMKKPYDNG